MTELFIIAPDTIRVIVILIPTFLQNYRKRQTRFDFGILGRVSETEAENRVDLVRQVQKRAHPLRVVANTADIANAQTRRFRGHGAVLRKQGHIAFLGHGDVLEFKDIRVKALQRP